MTDEIKQDEPELVKVKSDKKKKVVRRLRKDAKYKKIYTDELNSGIRFKRGLSIVELCKKWRISKVTYYNWVDRYQDFSDAHEMGEIDYAAWMHDNFKKIMTGKKKGNAQCAIFAMTNINQIHWRTRVDVTSDDESAIGTININVLPAPKAPPVLEQLQGNVIEHEVPNNVVSLHGEED